MIRTSGGEDGGDWRSDSSSAGEIGRREISVSMSFVCSLRGSHGDGLVEWMRLLIAAFWTVSLPHVGLCIT